MADQTNDESTVADQVRRERERAASVIARQRRELDRLHAERRALRQQVTHLERKLDQTLTSTTWKLGDAILSLPKRIKDAVRDRRRGGASAGQAVLPTRTPPAALRMQVEAREDDTVRAAYEEALKQRRFEGDGPAIAFLVSTIDLSEGRGDLFVAVGLGRALQEQGCEVIYLPPKDWYDLPSGTDVVVSLLAERTATLDPLKLPSTVTTVAWIRNNVERWTDLPWLHAYDGILCSSRNTEQRVRRHYAGPTGVCPIAVDEALFVATDEGTRRGVVTTVNQRGDTRATFAGLAGIDIDFPLAIFGIQRNLAPSVDGFTHGPASFFSLPSVYRRAAVVLDDQQDANVVHGNVNSRIYESLAAGALPVTNTAAGLGELGLQDVPVARSPQELQTVVTGLLGDESRRTALVEDLRRVVLEQHTYTQRAATFWSFLEENGLLEQERPRAPVLGFFPDYTITNPFQDMLYASVRERGCVTVPVRDPFDLATLPAAADRQLVFHVHWTAPVLGPASDEPDARSRAGAFLEGLDMVREQGGRVVWTVHNAMPHECAYPDVERELRQGIADRADRIHVMCAATTEVTDGYELPAAKVEVIAHGSYVDVYPDVVTDVVARRELGLPADATVVLCLGQIRPYKGIDRLLDAFVEARAAVPSLHLVVAGAPGRFAGVQELLDQITATPGVTGIFEEIPDEELQVPLRASDVVVLPHERVLNSGAALLALSYGRPIIAPDTGCLPSLVTDDIGTTFVGRDGLAEALRRAADLDTPAARRAAYLRAREHTSADMADAFASMVEDDLGVTLGTDDEAGDVDG